jgi:hypothetical protein
MQFFILQSVKTVSAAHGISYYVGTKALFSAARRQRRDTGHLPNSTGENKNDWGSQYASTDSYIYMAGRAITLRLSYNYNKSCDLGVYVSIYSCFLNTQFG